MENRRLIDVRQPGEFAAGYIEGAELVPLGRLSRACAEWDHKQPITLICRSGHRAEIAQRQLRSRGFTDVTVLPGGMQRWKAAGKPLQTVPQGLGRRIAGWVISLGVVAVSVVLARVVSPWFLAVPAFVAVRWMRARA